MVTTTSVCTKTLMEKVYMAKDAVFISPPNMVKTHCVPPCLATLRISSESVGTSKPLALHGLLGSLASTAVADALASSSRVMGIKAPRPQTTKTSAAKP